MSQTNETIVKGNDSVFSIDPSATDLAIHPFAETMPMLYGKEYEAFKDSISAGQQTPIIVHDGILLDGRNRLRACRDLGIEVQAVEFNGTSAEEKALIIALNLHRRHLTPSQRAALAIELLPDIEEAAAARMKDGGTPRLKLIQGKATNIAGAQANVSGSYVAVAKKIYENSPETYQKLLDGTLTIPQAKKQISPEKNPSPEPVAKQYSSWLEVLKELKLMIHEDYTPDILAIAEASSSSIRKVIMTCFAPEVNEVANIADEAAGDEQMPELVE